MLTHIRSQRGHPRRAIRPQRFKKRATRPRLATARHISSDLAKFFELIWAKNVCGLGSPGGPVIATVVALGGSRRPKQDLFALRGSADALEEECDDPA